MARRAAVSSEVLPGLHYLRNGHVRELVAGDEVLLEAISRKRGETIADPEVA
jgi:hypothetical protein